MMMVPADVEGMKGENFINEQSFSPTRDLEEEYIHVYVERRGEESVPRVDTAYANRGEPVP